MQADDPRHGTNAGAVQHWKDKESPCPPCAQAGYRARKGRRAEPATVPAIGARRRLQALLVLGYSYKDLPQRLGVSRRAVCDWIRGKGGGRISRRSHERIDRLYRELCMTPNPDADVRTINAARRNGYAPPLAWDNIDDPDEQPTYDADPADGLDEIAIWRRLNGDKTVKLSRPEQDEAWRQWEASGKGYDSFEKRTGISANRARKRIQGAA